METQQSISKWATSTFGEPENGLVLIEKLKEETYELASACVIYQNILLKSGLDKVMDEIADVTIMSYQVCNWYGYDLNEIVSNKMQINRSRKWDITEQGIGQHKEE